MCFVKGPHKDEERFVSYLIFDYLRLVPLLLSNPSEFSWLLVSFHPISCGVLLVTVQRLTQLVKNQPRQCL